ncbi:recombinase family protein [Paenibacillus sp. FSL R5-0912]|uniref:recombinase family protein n=1 Tax=Paenibacillus sp. FSL R5-0912 TaxID=1536771 RepID=UPI0005AB26FC|nr:recombinase family protein [Paenibacillus sp. FSL R5-0912]
MASKKFGYTRTSKMIQREDRQIDMLIEFGVDAADIYVDKMTGAHMEREQLKKLQQVLRPADTVVVESLSRLSRSTKDLLSILEDWDKRDIVFVSLKEKLDFSSTTGKLILTILSAIAQFEKDMIRDRVMEGLAAAKQRGRVGGRPKTPKFRIEDALKLYAANIYSVSEISKRTGVSRSVLYRTLREEANQSLTAKNEGK